MEKIFIKPAKEGNQVRHPKKLAYVIKPEGEWVVSNRDWLRMILQGDIVVAQPPDQHKKEKRKKEKAEEKDNQDSQQSPTNPLDNSSKEGE